MSEIIKNRKNYRKYLKLDNYLNKSVRAHFKDLRKVTNKNSSRRIANEFEEVLKLKPHIFKDKERKLAEFLIKHKREYCDFLDFNGIKI